MKTKIYITLSIAFLTISIACTDKKATTNLKKGNWYGEFITETSTIPFLFEISENSNGAPLITLKNGEERVVLTETKLERDSIYIPVTDYETEFQGILTNDTIKGVFKRIFNKEDKGVPFQAIYGDLPRFTQNGSSTHSLAGKWDIAFISEQGTKNNIGIFQETGNTLTGSVLTTTGDFRYLEGISDQKGFRLSSFSGLSPYLIQGAFTDPNHFEGEFITPRSVQKIAGKRNPNAELPDPYSLTEFTGESRKLSFQLPDLNGNIVSLSDEKFKNKVVVVSILGSWCPNCLDEINFLAPWYNENRERGVEIVGIAFERKDDPEEANKILSRLKEKYNIPYPILFAGKTSDSEKVLPEIKKLLSYPTTFFIDKQGNIRKIHTGFNGPATGEFYEEFKEEFNQTIDELINE